MNLMLSFLLVAVSISAVMSAPYQKNGKTSAQKSVVQKSAVQKSASHKSVVQKSASQKSASHKSTVRHRRHDENQHQTTGLYYFGQQNYHTEATTSTRANRKNAGINEGSHTKPKKVNTKVWLHLFLDRHGQKHRKKTTRSTTTTTTTTAGESEVESIVLPDIEAVNKDETETMTTDAQASDASASNDADVTTGNEDPFKV